MHYTTHQAPPSKKRNQRGSAIFYVLTAIALFSALSYAVGNMLKSSGSDVDREKLQLYAVEIIDYAGAVRRAILDVKASNSCTDEEISFASDLWDPTTLYDNANAPSDKSCHVFDSNGGGVPWREAPNGEDYRFSGHRYIEDVGTTGADAESRAELYLTVPVHSILCKTLNDQNDIENPSGSPPDIDETESDNAFTGSFDGTDAIATSGVSASGLAATRGKMAFCGNETTTEHHYVHVLIAR